MRAISLKKILYVSGIIFVIACIFIGFKLHGKFFISRALVDKNENLPTTVVGNDFIYTVVRADDKLKIKKTAAVFLLDSKLIVFEQSSLPELWVQYGFDRQYSNIKPYMEKQGGLKQIINYEDNLLGVVSLVDGDCYFGAILNFTSGEIILRAPCLEDINGIDFNVLGGGYAFSHGKILIAFGAPEMLSTSISALAQNINSPYGKILEFEKKQLVKIGSNKTYKIFSSGHRNPQGILAFNEKVIATEHGPKGGDEINFISRSGNYGWPKYSLGSTYTDIRYDAGSPKSKKYSGPDFAFIPSIAISDIRECPKIISSRYSSYDCFLLSTLREKSIFVVLADINNNKIISTEKIDVGRRVREFVRGSGDDIYISADNDGLYKINIRGIEGEK